MFYLSLDGWAVVGASPEVLVRMDGGEILVRPIAGTRPRGKTRDEDLALERELTRDEKELAEHRMLVDLGRNDVGRVARVGSVEVERALHVERYSHVMHIVSDVHGTVRQGSSAYDVLRACFPAGTVSGAPKIRAMELIAQLEPERRGLYAGAVGYFDFTGNMDTCIAIRTLIVKPGAVYLQAGAGIVFDSVPEAEHAECMNKAKSGLVAIAQTLAAEGASR
jgi:anthranilate synthase component 1